MRVNFLFLMSFLLVSFFIFPDEDELFYAAESDERIDTVKHYIEKLGTNINIKGKGYNQDNRSLLNWAVIHGSLKTTEYLLEKGAFIDDRTLKETLQYKLLEVMKLFLKNKDIFSRVLTDGSYKDNSKEAELRRSNKIMMTFKTGSISSYQEMINSDPDFETNSKKRNIINYAIINNKTQYMYRYVLFLKTLADYNATLSKPLVVSIKNLTWDCINDNVDNIINYMKEGETLDSIQYFALGASESFKTIDYLTKKDIIRFDAPMGLIEGLIYAGNVDNLKKILTENKITFDLNEFLSAKLKDDCRIGNRFYVHLDEKHIEMLYYLFSKSEIDKKAIDLVVYLYNNNQDALKESISDISSGKYNFSIIDLFNENNRLIFFFNSQGEEGANKDREGGNFGSFLLSKCDDEFINSMLNIPAIKSYLARIEVGEFKNEGFIYYNDENSKSKNPITENKMKLLSNYLTANAEELEKLKLIEKEKKRIYDMNLYFNNSYEKYCKLFQDITAFKNYEYEIEILELVDSNGNNMIIKAYNDKDYFNALRFVQFLLLYKNTEISSVLNIENNTGECVKEIIPMIFSKCSKEERLRTYEIIKKNNFEIFLYDFDEKHKWIIDWFEQFVSMTENGELTNSQFIGILNTENNNDESLKSILKKKLKKNKVLIERIKNIGVKL